MVPTDTVSPYKPALGAGFLLPAIHGKLLGFPHIWGQAQYALSFLYKTAAISQHTPILHPPKGIAVNAGIDDYINSINDAIQEFSLSMPMAIDSSSDLAQALRLAGTPNHLMFDKEMNLIYHGTGPTQFSTAP